MFPEGCSRTPYRLLVVQCQESDSHIEVGPEPIIEPSPRSRFRLAYVSARFDGSPVELTMRRVQRILAERGLEILMAEVESGQDFGNQTMAGLWRIKKEQGVLLAVCTWNYAEKTSSPYSSHAELLFAYDHGVDVLPLRFDDAYPPSPPFGPDHLFDKDGTAQALLHMVFPPSKVYLDCQSRSDNEIADKIQQKLARQ